MMLTTPRLLLRPFAPEDGQDLYDYLSDPQVVAFEPYDAFTLEAAKAEAAQRARNSAFIAVCLQNTGKLIGNLYLGEHDALCRELGYVFHRAYWGQGYAAEAATAALSDLFANTDTHRVIAQLNPQNTASERLLRRIGMRLEGRLLSNVYFRVNPQTGEPVWQDTLLYAVLRDEWLAMHPRG